MVCLDGCGGGGGCAGGDTFRFSNDPLQGSADEAGRPLAPLRISRAVGASLFDATLAFYGVGAAADGSAGAAAADALGFSHSTILLDETDSASGDRAVTIMLAPNATVHLQLWARSEEDDDDDAAGPPPFPSPQDFEAAVGSNQVNGGQPSSSAAFCAAGQWTVASYNAYVLSTHETVMSPIPNNNAIAATTAADTAAEHGGGGGAGGGDGDGDGDDVYLHPPAGSSFDAFVDDHLSWDCTNPTECDLASGGTALYALGSRVQWLGSPDGGWAAYSYDPSGFGFELHW
jgi:hypothetical protein